MKTRLAVAALALVATAFLVARAARSNAAPVTPDRDAAAVTGSLHSEVAPTGTPVGALEARPMHASRPDFEGRQALSEEGWLVGRVVETGGRAIAGARLQWTPLTDELADPSWRVSDVDAASIRAATVTTTTAADGRFVFPAPPPGVESSVSAVWVSGPGHFADVAIVPAWADAETRELAPFELAPAPRSTVRVVDSSGQPVAGAQVHQRLLMLDPETTPAVLVRARLVFAHMLRTGAEGTASLHALPADQGLSIARHGALVSRPSLASGSITLTLRGSFELQGTVSVAGDAAPREARVAIQARVAGELVPLGSLVVGPAGRFGPASFAVLPDADYVFSLSGGGVEPRQRQRPAPRAGERLELALATRAGQTLAVDVRAPDGSPIERARIEALWEGDGTTAGGAVGGTTDAAGRAELQGLPQRLVTLAVRAESFAARAAVGPFLTTRSEPIELVLEPAITIHGSVVRAGRAVERFDVVWWSDDPATRTATSFEDSAGRFSLVDAPRGGVTLVAIGPDGPESAPVTVGGASDRPVELVLPTGRQGSVRIVDGSTGAPIEEAHVRLWATVADQLLVGRGALQPVRTDGWLHSSDFGPETTGLEIRADGYASYWTTVATPAVGPVHVGDVALFRPARAQVRLLGAEDLDLSSIRAWTDGGNRVALPAFDSNAGVELTELRPFFTRFVVELPDGDRTVLGADLVAGEATLVEVDLGAGAALSIDLAGTAAELEATHTARVWSVDEDGRLHLRERTFRGSHVALDRLRGTSATVEIADARERTLGLGRVELTPAEVPSIVLPIGLARRAIEVVEPSGDPVPNATVTARLVGGAGWSQTVLTDAAGRAELVSTSAEQVVTLQHAELGRIVGVPVPPPSRSDEPTRITFESGVELELDLFDDGQPQPNVWVWVLDPETGETRADAVTDTTGSARLGRFAPGTYLAYAHSPGFWPVPLEFELEPSGAPVAVDVFRNGEATFAVRVAGLPASAVEVRLHYVEDFALGLEEWISSGGIAALSQPLATDASGGLLVTGLPRGDYEWTAILTDGRSEQGRLSVPPHGSTEVAIDLP